MFTIILFNQLMSKGLPFAVGLVPARKQARLSSWSSWLTHAHEMNIFYVLQWRFFTHIWICTLCMTFVCLCSTVTYFYFNMLFEFRSINADICPGTHVSIPSSVNIFWMVIYGGYSSVWPQECERPAQTAWKRSSGSRLSIPTSLLRPSDRRSRPKIFVATRWIWEICSWTLCRTKSHFLYTFATSRPFPVEKNIYIYILHTYNIVYIYLWILIEEFDT